MSEANMDQSDSDEELQIYGEQHLIQGIELSAWAKGLKDNSTTTTVRVFGAAGVGKTTICRHALAELPSDYDVVLLQGKFKQFQALAGPYAAIVAALSQMTDQCSVESLQRSAKESKVILDLIPSLACISPSNDRKLSVSSDSENPETMALAPERFAIALVNLWRNLDRPILLYMDDIQFADLASWTLLSALVQSRLPRLGILLTHHDTETSNNTILFDNSIAWTREIHVSNWTVQDVRAMLLDKKGFTSDLAEIFYDKTQGGNPLLCKLLLRDIQGDLGVLSLMDRDGYAVAHHLQKLPHAVLLALQIAACMGFAVDRSLWEAVYQAYPFSSPKSDFQDILATAVQNEIFVPDDDDYYRFSHDRMQQWLYEMIPLGRTRGEMHLRIGKLLQTLFQSELAPFLVADQLSRGAKFASTSQERIGIVQLCLDASLLARMKHGIGLHADYLEKAIELVIEPDDWASHFALLMEIFSLAAEVEFALGNFDVSRSYVDKVLAFAKTVDEKARVLIVSMQMYGANRRFSAALQEAQKALTMLGFSLPPHSRLYFSFELLRTKLLLSRRLTAYPALHDLPKMEERNKSLAMKIMEFCCVYTWNSDPTYSLSCFVYFMRLTLLYGMCVETPVALCFFGLVLAQMGNEAEAFRMSELALGLRPAKSKTPAVNLLVSVFLSHLRLPLAKGLSSLLSAYRTGLRTGEIFFGPIALCAYADLYMICGLPLLSAISDFHQFGIQLNICRHDLSLSFLLPWYRCALNLAGKTNDNVKVDWEACRQHDIFRDSVTLDEASPPGLYLIYVQMFNALIMKNVSICERSLERLLALPNRRLGCTHFANSFFVFLDGIVSAAILRKVGESPMRRKRYLRLLRESIRELGRTSKRRAGNCLGLVALLLAEWKALKGANKSATSLYSRSISMLSREGLTNFAAIANELTFDFMHKQRDEYWAKYYFRAALESYDAWGATAKVNDLKLHGPFPNIMQDEEDTHLEKDISIVVNINGRKRFDPSLDSFENLLETESLSNRGFRTSMGRSRSSFRSQSIGEQAVATTATAQKAD